MKPLPVLLGLSAMGLLLLESGRRSQSSGLPSSQSSSLFGGSIMTGFRFVDEIPTIEAAAESFGIDARFLAALRMTEDGRPGREFGVLSVPAPTYLDQVTIAARTIANNIPRYQSITGDAAVGEDGRYTDGFIRYFSNVYAPVGADNDPNGLNQYHYSNLSAFYAGIEG